MKTVKFIYATLITLAALCLMCACQKGSSENKATANTAPTPAGGYWEGLEQAAQISGNRLQQMLKDKEKEKNESGEAGKSDAEVPNIKNDITADPNAGPESTAKPERTEMPIAEDMEGGNAGFQQVTSDYSKKIDDETLKEIKKIAQSYIKATYSTKVKTTSVAADTDKLYKNNLIYNPGNILVIKCKCENGKTYYVAVARENSESEWKAIADRKA